MSKIYLKSGRLLFKCDKGFPNNGFACQLHLFGGAGYRNGRTAYLAYNSGSLHWLNQFRGGVRSNGKRVPFLARLFKVELGITKNANIVPYMSH